MYRLRKVFNWDGIIGLRAAVFIPVGAVVFTSAKRWDLNCFQG